MKKKISVLVVEHDPMLLLLESNFIESMGFFRVCGKALSLHALEQHLRYAPERPDLVVMEPFLPFNSTEKAFALLRPRRQHQEARSEVIIVSRCPERNAITEAFAFGIFDYIIKPFTVERLRQSLALFEKYFFRIATLPEQIDQDQVDRVFRRTPPFHENCFSDLPKNLNRETAARMLQTLREGDAPLSLEEAAKKSGLSKTTVWRYLSYLVDAGTVKKIDDQGSTGRPLLRFFPVAETDTRIHFLRAECKKEEING